MDDKNKAEPPQKYTWPRYVLAGVVLWLVLVIIWMGVLVRRTRQQRDFTPWPTIPQPITRTNSAPIITNADSLKSH
jgi:hypothetical protein